MSSIKSLFEVMALSKASDLHLAEGSPPILRVHGGLQRIDDHEPLDRARLIAYMREICPEDRWRHFARAGDLDFAYAVGSSLRLRANYFMKETGVGAVFRVVPTRIATLDEIQAPRVLRRLAELDNGLVLVTGPTGSGKSTTLAAMVDHINARSSKRIITIEEPIEFIHERKRSIIVQREVGRDAVTFDAALHAVGRMDFDVILVGEMRDFETIAAALHAAELGVLVLGTLHTNSAVKAVDRIIDVFPAKQQPQIRGLLSEVLRGVCTQTLLKRADGRGRVAAHEVLVQTNAVRAAIREGKTQGLVSAMQSGRGLGMRLMDDVIAALLRDDVITRDEAYAKALDKSRFSAEAGDADDSP